MTFAPYKACKCFSVIDRVLKESTVFISLVKQHEFTTPSITKNEKDLSY